MRFLDETDPRRAVWEACGNPLEQMLCFAMFALLGCRAVRGQFNRSRLRDLAKLCDGKPACFLFGEHMIGRYRADFLVVAVDPIGQSYRPLVIIESNGNSYHSSEGITDYDRRRVADIDAAGYRVMTVGTSDIYFGAKEVLEEIQAWIEAGGCICEPPDDLRNFSWMLAQFTPSKTVWEDRDARRTEYWRDLAIEQRIRAGIRQDDL